MTMVLISKQSNSTLSRYKKSGLVRSAVPGSAVRISLPVQHSSGRSTTKKSSKNSSSSNTSSSTKTLKKKRTKIRSITSKVLTVRHNILKTGGHRTCWVRTRSGGYVRQQSEPCFQDKYSVAGELGKGGFGTVYSGIRISDQAPVAIKHVSRCKVIAWDVVNGYKVPQELKLLLEVQSVEGVVKLLDFYEREDSFIYVLERPTNYMDLFDFITREKRLSEEVARNMMREVVRMVVECSKLGIVHRDIKDENLLVNLDNLNLTLIDFGSGGIIKDKYYTVILIT